MKRVGLDQILRDLKDSDPEIKRMAANAILQESPSPDTLIAEILEDADKPTAMAIYDVLFYDDNDYPAIFLNAAIDPDPRVRRLAVRYLFRRGLFRVEDGIKWLADDDPYVRRRVISYLFWLNGGAAIDPVMAIAQGDPDEKVRKDALRLIAKWGEKKDAQYLIKILEDPSVDIRMQAIHALKRLTGEDFGEPIGASDDEFEWIVAKWQGWWEIMRERI
ncbi:MAG TPA: HEAT repeat domain-containing protein [Deltaproteobacteria bacterium]|nr:HEAT repeat domain-containing protein [Deltaproteobacteria bacterium]HPJ93864.1 HEAT repeat domain-containing protein [Deltaproteobacteria bacterium]HPR53341.1 HEAT repeat domain-containing protein [Deltaproteobacteria bacterium]